MLRRSACLPIALLLVVACEPRVPGSKRARSPGAPKSTATATATTTARATTTPTSTAPTATATSTATAPTATATATATTTAPTTTATADPHTPAPTATATTTASSAPAKIDDDLIPACRTNCDALRNACSAGDATGCYKLCDEYDRTLTRACRGVMATYFRCLSWTATCEGGTPRSDTAKCEADQKALAECRG